MNRYAVEVDSDNIAIRVIVCDSVAWAEENLGGVWLPSENKVAPGSTYDNERETFIPPKPFESWVLNGDVWEAPIPRPVDGEYVWDEDAADWVPADV